MLNQTSTASIRVLELAQPREKSMTHVQSGFLDLDDEPGPVEYQKVEKFYQNHQSSKYINSPKFSVKKSVPTKKMVITGQHKAELLCYHSPGVGVYEATNGKFLEKFSRNENFTCSFGKARREANH